MKTRRSYRIAEGNKYAIVNVDKHFGDDDAGRYPYIISQFFTYAGYKIIVKTNRDYFRRMNRFYKHVLLKQDYLFVRNCSTPLNSIVVQNGSNESKTIQFDYGYHLAHSDQHDCVATFPLHPSLYENYPSSAQFELLRNAHRVMKIFFSGNADVNRYSRTQLQDRFKIMNRVDLINSVKEHFSDSRNVVVLEKKEQLHEFLNQGEAQRKIIISQDKTDSKDWLHTLSKSDFFLCPPGVRMPWCHNLIESMAVGTIPILQYAHWCSPPLTDKENCLAFENAEELREVIEIALNMEEDEIERMRQNVVRYYETYLSLQVVLNKINQFSQSDKKFTSVAIPFIPTDYKR